MLATGGLLVCLALLALGVLGPIFRRSNPPAWTQRRWIGEVVTLAIVCALAIGLGYLGAGVINAAQGSLDYLDLVLLAGVLLVAVVTWRHWRGRRRAAAEPMLPTQAPPPRRAA